MQRISLREALRQAMCEEMERDDDVFLMGEEVGHYNGAYKVSKGMLEKFGARRVIDTPISEAGFVGVGVGAALAGLKPIVEVMTFNFAILALDQMINHAAKARYMSGGQLSVPMVLRGPSGFAKMLSAQHSQSLESQYTNCPGLKVVSCAAPRDAKGLLKSAIRDPDPVIFMESEFLYGIEEDVPEEEYLVPLGKARVLREGDDVTLVAWNKMRWRALEAAEALASAGISVEVIDPLTLKPLDLDTILASVSKTSRIVVVDEMRPFASTGSEIAHQVTSHAFDDLDHPPLVVNTEDVPIPYNKFLEDLAVPSVEKIVAACRKVSYLD
jgi:pyruvate dehydrogenase E1 component beta subunit